MEASQANGSKIASPVRINGVSVIILDSAKFAIGAASAAWLSGGTLLARIEGALMHVLNLLVRGLLALLAQIRHAQGLLGLAASPMAR